MVQRGTHDFQDFPQTAGTSSVRGSTVWSEEE